MVVVAMYDLLLHVGLHLRLRFNSDKTSIQLSGLMVVSEIMPHSILIELFKADRTNLVDTGQANSGLVGFEILDQDNNRYQLDLK